MTCTKTETDLQCRDICVAHDEQKYLTQVGLVVKVGCRGTDKNIANVEVHGDRKAKKHANSNLSLDKAKVHLLHVTF